MTLDARLHAPRPTRLAVQAAILAWLGCAATAGALAAQVGYDPAHSPYRDIPGGGVAVVSAGYLGGSRGSVGVGLSNGATGGLRYEVSFGAVGASLGLAYGLTTRFVWIVDPTQDVARLRPVRRRRHRSRREQRRTARHERLRLRHQDHARPQRRAALVSGAGHLGARRLPPGTLEAQLPAPLQGAEQH